jgi:hypothetical protein
MRPVRSCRVSLCGCCAGVLMGVLDELFELADGDIAEIQFRERFEHELGRADELTSELCKQDKRSII